MEKLIKYLIDFFQFNFLYHWRKLPPSAKSSIKWACLGALCGVILIVITNNIFMILFGMVLTVFNIVNIRRVWKRWYGKDIHFDW